MSMEDDMKKKLIEALIFISGGSISRKDIAKKTSVKLDSLEIIIDEIKEYYKDRGINIVDDGKQVGFFTAAALEDNLNEIEKDDLNGPLSKSAKETLTTIAYCGPIVKGDIDFIRGVNVQFILRKLLLRGLVQKEQSNNATRYTVTVDFLASMCVNDVKNLPHYDSTRMKILDGLEEVKGMLKD